ncbi:hypothetical protein VC83_00009 [Pseudogymnoascus destructans]|uniref:Uncharacterized protein n=1 Tax=Pseudogymnoascus destructans TaxID=655981 RepID=A0A177AP09_9PEZI|nr:uncharacterized protein VC83_00009 [Pseudogymnoascus destructans]OAF63252.1 hypothetical protein VC83_00009 [Pseudogymnoascus destructans]
MEFQAAKGGREGVPAPLRGAQGRAEQRETGVLSIEAGRASEHPSWSHQDIKATNTNPRSAKRRRAHRAACLAARLRQGPAPAMVCRRVVSQPTVSGEMQRIPALVFAVPRPERPKAAQLGTQVGREPDTSLLSCPFGADEWATPTPASGVRPQRPLIRSRRSCDQNLMRAPASDGVRTAAHHRAERAGACAAQGGQGPTRSRTRCTKPRRRRHEHA